MDTIPLRYAQSLLRLTPMSAEQLREELLSLNLPLVLLQPETQSDARIPADDYGRLFIHLVRSLQATLPGGETGAAGAPKTGDAAAWAPRIAKGMDTLYGNAINGVGAMPAKGLCADCSDDEINEAQHDIDEKCLVLIATQQPMAGDLRAILAVSNIAAELERMGDYSEGIAKLAIKLAGRPLLKPLIDIPRMADEGRRMLMASLEAFARQDVEAAAKIGQDERTVLGTGRRSAGDRAASEALRGTRSRGTGAAPRAGLVRAPRAALRAHDRGPVRDDGDDAGGRVQRPRGQPALHRCARHRADEGPLATGAGPAGQPHRRQHRLCPEHGRHHACRHPRRAHHQHGQRYRQPGVQAEPSLQLSWRARSNPYS